MLLHIPTYKNCPVISISFILGPARFQTHPRSYSIKTNTSVLLECSYNNYTAISLFSWIKDGKVLDASKLKLSSTTTVQKSGTGFFTGSTQFSQSLSFTVEKADQQGFYWCRIQDSLSRTVESNRSTIKFTGNQPCKAYHFLESLYNRSSIQQFILRCNGRHPLYGDVICFHTVFRDESICPLFRGVRCVKVSVDGGATFLRKSFYFPDNALKSYGESFCPGNYARFLRTDKTPRAILTSILFPSATRFQREKSQKYFDLLA